MTSRNKVWLPHVIWNMIMEYSHYDDVLDKSRNEALVKRIIGVKGGSDDDHWWTLWWFKEVVVESKEILL